MKNKNILYIRLIKIIESTAMELDMRNGEINEAILKLLEFDTFPNVLCDECIKKAGKPTHKKVGRPKGSKNKKK